MGGTLNTKEMHAVLSIEQVPPWILQYEGSEQVVTKSCPQIGEYGVDVHASPVAEQVRPTFGQLASTVHAALVELQSPPTGGQLASTVQVVVMALVQVPGWVGHSARSMPVTWHALPTMLQVLAMPQPGTGVHTTPSIEHVPPTGGQSGSPVQTALVALQREGRTHEGSLKHTALSTVQCPAWSGQPALF
jgi:hypothetical protein